MYFWCTDIVAYHRELEKLSRECQDKTLFLAKRDELDAQMATRTRLIMDVRGTHIGIVNTPNLTLRTQHARLCEEGSMRLKEGQVADKEEQTIQRVTLYVSSSILSTFLNHRTGYMNACSALASNLLI